MTRHRDRALFPQTLLRLVSVGLRLRARPSEAFRQYVRDFRSGASVSRELLMIAEDLDARGDLAGALKRHARLFPVWLPPLLEWGAASDRVDHAIDAANRLLAAETRITELVRSGLRYPSMLAAITAAYLLLDAVVTWPTLNRIIESLERVSNSGHWMMPVLNSHAREVVLGFASLMLLLPIGVMMVADWPFRVTRERRVRQLMAWLPGGSGALALLEQGLAATLLGGALSTDLPLPDALRHAARCADRPGKLPAALEEAALRLEGGASLEHALSLGEGHLAAFLVQVSCRLRERDADRRLSDLGRQLTDQALVEVSGLASCISPCVVLLVGVVLAVIGAAQFGVLDFVGSAAAASLSRR